VSSLASLPGRRVLAGTHQDGVFLSRDDGRTWEPSANGFSHRQVYSLAIAREPAGDVLYAGTEPVSLYRSVDGGDRWQELPAIARVPGAEKWTFPPPPHEAHTKALTVDRARPTTLYAAIEQGALLKSADGGASWTEIEGYARTDDQVYRDMHRLLQAPWDHALLFLATGDGFSRSTDGGKSWEQSAALKRHIGYPDVMVVSPRDDQTLFVAGAKGSPAAWFQTGTAEGTLYRSRDGGQTWEPANAGLPRDARANLEAMTLVAHPGGLSLFVGNTDGEYFTSDDLGDSWSTIATGLAPVSKAGHHAMLRTFSSMPARLRPAFAFTAAAVLGVTARVAAARRAARMKRARAFV
jgi:photosystem II stability/assembly factor-like uncharacterized protein